MAGAPVREVEPVEARQRWRCCCRAGRRLAHRALVELHRERLRRQRRARVRVRSGFGGRLARRRVLRSLLLDHCASKVPDVEHRTVGLLQVLLGRVFEPSRGREVRGVGDASASASDGAGLALHRPSDRQRVKDALGATLVRAGCERHDKRSAHEREQRDDSRLVAIGGTSSRAKAHRGRDMRQHSRLRCVANVHQSSSPSATVRGPNFSGISGGLR